MERLKSWKIYGTCVLGPLLTALVGPATAGSVFVDTDYVAKSKGKPGVVLVDVRSADEFRKGLIRGAVVVDDAGAARALRDAANRIRPVKKMEAILGKAGLSRDDETIVYGAKGDTGPYVVFWILDYLGAEKARVYHGGDRRLDGGRAAANQCAPEFVRNAVRRQGP